MTQQMPMRRIQAPPTNQTVSKISFLPTVQRLNRRVMIYGTGGIGKTLLGCLMPGKTVAFDHDDSLLVLAPQLEEMGIEMPARLQPKSYQEMRTMLSLGGWEGVNNIFIDTIGFTEELCIKHIIETVKTSDEKQAINLESYGYGKDVRLVYEYFLPLLGDLERHYLAGRNILLIAHDCKPEETNPMGTNYVRWEPRLRSSKKGENSIRFKVKEWCDYVGFISYDISNTKERGKEIKKATSGGTRTMYLEENPAYMAKNRGVTGPIDIEFGKSPWSGIFPEPK